MGSLSINLLGTNFKINAQQDEQYLQQLLDYYTGVIGQLRENIPNQDPLQLAILAGIMISDELYAQKYDSNSIVISKEYSQTLSQIENITQNMIKHIDKVL